jgi:hypothetical protein
VRDEVDDAAIDDHAGMDGSCNGVSCQFHASALQ